MIKEFKNFGQCTIHWLGNNLGCSSGPVTFSLEIFNKFHRILITRGKKEAISFCKERRLFLYQTLEKSDNIEEIKLILLRAPFKELRALGRKSWLSTRSLRLVITTLVFSRTIRLPVEIDTSTITDGPTYVVPTRFYDYIEDFWSEIGYKPTKVRPKSSLWKSFHISTKSGPNGQAMWSSLEDLLHMPDSLILEVKALGGKKFSDRLDVLLGHLNTILPFYQTLSLTKKKTNNLFRKLSGLPDKEGKTRVVAILDYWSQTVLKPIHDYLFKALRKIPQDCTFDQSGFLNILNKDSKDAYLSADLSAATDRFPIDIIKEILFPRLQDEAVSCWSNIMVGYSFKNKSAEFNYSCGNPMGAYSSWNSFAIAHHYVMYYCCRMLEKDWKTSKYVILGDDIVIYDAHLSIVYKEVMSSLGVNISLDKSHISLHFFEFAKRIFWNGEEMTPFPVAALWETRKDHKVIQTLSHERKRNWEFSDGIPSSITRLYEYLGFPRRFRSKRETKYLSIFSITEYLNGALTAQEALGPIVEKSHPRVFEIINTRDNAESIWTNIILGITRLSFSESVENMRNPKAMPLGYLAEMLLIFLTSLDIDEIELCLLIQSIPILPIHGQLEETYLKLMSEAYVLDDSGSDWNKFMKFINIPLSDCFYYRNADPKITCAGALTVKLFEQLDALDKYPQLI